MMKKLPTKSLSPAANPATHRTSTAVKDTAMNYQHLAFMSYAVPTFYPSPPGLVAAVGGAPTIQLADADLQARAQRFINVLFWTQQQFAGEPWMNDADTLKVFQAPEFYFRSAHPTEVQYQRFSIASFYGSYPESARYALAEALYGAIHGRPEFADWVITAGTICSALHPVDDERLDLLNTAIMMRGQRSTMDASVPYILMEKHYISNLDGPRADWHADLNPATAFSRLRNPDFALDNIIRWDGMLTGLEVCLDHRCGVLSRALLQMWNVIGPDTLQLDLHTIVSCGMDIQQPNIAVRNGGLVLLTDGMSREIRGYPTPSSRMCRYVRQGDIYAVLDAVRPPLTVLPAGADYNVAYPHYAGQQGVYAFEPLPILEQ